jgi:hypothetical protein
MESEGDDGSGFLNNFRLVINSSLKVGIPKSIFADLNPETRPESRTAKSWLEVTRCSLEI